MSKKCGDCKNLKKYLLSKPDSYLIDKEKTFPAPFSIFQLGEKKGTHFPNTTSLKHSV